METLTDFATVQYFNVETVTVGRVPDLARHVRPRRGQRDRHARARVRPARDRPRADPARPGPLRRVGRPGRRRRAAPPARLAGASRRRSARRAVVVRRRSSPRPLRLRDVGDRRAARARGARRWSTRYLEFLGNSLALTAVTVAICLRRRRRSSPTPAASAGRAVVGIANRVSIVGYAVPGPVVAMGVVLALVALDDLLERRRRSACPASSPPARSSPSPTPTRSASSRPA